MTTTAHEDQYTAAPEPVRQPYDTVAILRRNVADLELALRTQTERAEAAEADIERYVGINAELATELASLREQKPVAYVKYKATGGNVGLAWMAIPTGEFYPREGEKLYTDPVPAPAVPTNTIPEGDDFNGTTPHMIRCIESLVAMNDRGALAPHGLCGHSRTLLLASANRLRQQQAHVVPAVPELDPMTRLIVSDPKQLKLKKQEPAVPEWPAMLRTRRFIRREAWNPEAFIWFKPGDDRNHSTVMLYTHGKVHAGWIGVHCDHHARDWVYCDDMARALLQSEVTK